MATVRAKRMAKILENRFGWSVYGGTHECPKCGAVYYSGSYCQKDGAKLKRRKDDSLDQLEEAIAYALGE